MKTHPWLLMPPQAWPHMAFLYINCRVEMILSQCSYTTQLTLASLSFLRVFNSSTSTKNITEVSLFNLKKAVCWNINRYQFVFLSRKKKINQSIKSANKKQFANYCELECASSSSRKHNNKWIHGNIKSRKELFTPTSFSWGGHWCKHIGAHWCLSKIQVSLIKKSKKVQKSKNNTFHLEVRLV